MLGLVVGRRHLCMPNYARHARALRPRSGSAWDHVDLTGENHESPVRGRRHDRGRWSRCRVHRLHVRGVRFNASSHTDAAFLNCTFVRCGSSTPPSADASSSGSKFNACTYDLLKVDGRRLVVHRPARAPTYVAGPSRMCACARPISRGARYAGAESAASTCRARSCARRTSPACDLRGATSRDRPVHHRARARGDRPVPGGRPGGGPGAGTSATTGDARASASGAKRTALPQERRRQSRHTGLPSVHL